MEDKKYLIIINMQIGFLNKDKENAINTTRNIVKEIMDGDYKYVYTLWDTSKFSNGDNSYKYSAEIIDAMQHVSISDGKFINCIENDTLAYTGWNYVIKDPTEIEVVGVYTDRFVIANVMQLKTLFPKANIVVKKNCCLGSNDTLNNQALQVMKSCQIEVI